MNWIRALMPLDRLAVGALAAAATLLLAVPSMAEPKRGGIVTAVVNPDPAFLVTAHNPIGGALDISSKIFEGLASYDLDMKLQPALAERWEVSPDGLTTTFYLRKDVQWHDGVPFTSKDVAFTLEKIWKVMHPRNRVVMSKVESVETPDDHTVILHLSSPAPYLLAVVNGNESQVVPQHIYDGEDVGARLVSETPVGTGPFKLKEWRKGEAIILERNPDYWQEGKPYLDGMIYRVITDEAARAAAFETGEIQYGVFGPVSPCTAQRLVNVEHLGVETKGYQFFGSRYIMEVNTRRPELSDKRVRQAIAHAVDVDFILENVFCGYGVKSTGPVPVELTEFYTPDVPTYPYDPQRAEELLDEAGYPRGADGTRFKIYHDPLPFGASYTRAAEVVKQNLLDVGIDVEIRMQDTPTWLTRIYTDNDFDLTSNTPSALPDPTLGIQRVYWSKNIIKGAPFSNGSGYSNPEMDEVLEAAANEPDAEKRKELFYRMQAIAQTDLPVIDLFVLQRTTIYDKKLKNHTMQADGYTNFADAYLEE
ncbi:ABC transporter substrate-binding protein [Frigidibacter sp.]|uniref:ABC transporter substrate-binding protein n=1 Tax=Frigidibacter sp. TaxID=2586418 RepID=UPI002734C2D3|nr:ABC transporter substrate-binding protein [Frigidibacter sp.]MDP3342366.1 ABC transporter substrate-binding protein [Frigidibacter sp.]